MTRTTLIKLFILPLALGFAACDREDTDNAEPNDAAVSDDADGKGPRGHLGLARLDVDQDRFISQAEANDHRIAGKFAEIDADQDGKLSREELHAISLTIHAPLMGLGKAEIIQRGIILGVDYGLTVSCYQADRDGRACGVCDSCRLRRAGFSAAGMADPTRYAG